MSEFDNSFLYEYKKLDELIKEVFDFKDGIDDYIDQVQKVDGDISSIKNWQQELINLKHIRWINNIGIPEKKVDCKKTDVEIIKNYYELIIKNEDLLIKVSPQFKKTKVKNLKDILIDLDDDEIVQRKKKLKAGETLIGEKYFKFNGWQRPIKIYYGGYVVPLFCDEFLILDQDDYDRVLNEFLSSEEGKQYEQPTEQEKKEAQEKVISYEVDYRKKQRTKEIYAIYSGPWDYGW